jgi:hypothetical protein
MNKLNKPPLFDRNHHNRKKVLINNLKVVGLATTLGASALGLALTGNNPLPKDGRTVQEIETLNPGVALRFSPFEDSSNSNYVETVKKGEKIVVTNPVEVQNPVSENGDVFDAFLLNGQTVYVDVTQVNKQSLEDGKNYITDSPANSTNYLPTKVEGNHYLYQDSNTGKWQEAGQSVTITNNNK